MYRTILLTLFFFLMPKIKGQTFTIKNDTKQDLCLYTCKTFEFQPSYKNHESNGCFVNEEFQKVDIAKEGTYELIYYDHQAFRSGIPEKYMKPYFYKPFSLEIDLIDKDPLSLQKVLIEANLFFEENKDILNIVAEYTYISQANFKTGKIEFSNHNENIILTISDDKVDRFKFKI